MTANVFFQFSIVARFVRRRRMAVGYRAAGRSVSRLLRKSRDRGHLPQIYKKGGHRSVRLPNPFVKRIYLTALTIASNAFGSFMARSARTLRFRAMPLALSLPMNCE